MFQDPDQALNPRMIVRDLVEEGLICQGIKDKNQRKVKVLEMIKLVGLQESDLARYPHEFSGGQKQRIVIARALIVKPTLIIADEPISALDVSIQAQILNLLNELKEKLKLTIVFISHDLSIVKYFCDRCAVMYHGNVVEMANVKDIFVFPQHQYTKTLLKDANLS
ncbi:ATP-binding cassette domain-containing protein [Candidatus Phytoplasma asteris]|uniref:ATP-binding cassette domain-containing protein n=1 Tax=Candidatus Phytoplasma asteris TaxID=85620 RepID=UPI0039DF3C39